MKVLVLSDTHFGHPKWGSFADDILQRARDIASNEDIDVVLHGGDVVEPGSLYGLEHGLENVSSIRARMHLWVAGNNDLEMLKPSRDLFLTYPDKLAVLGRRHGIHLLDQSPYTVDDVTFVGNFGGYGFGLWKPSEIPDLAYENTAADIEAKVDPGFKAFLGCGVRQMFETCQMRLRAHLSQLKGRGARVVVHTHTVPTSEMVVYGHSAKFDWKNAFMGWDDESSMHRISQTPGLVYQFCGHTHRYKYIERDFASNKAPLINVSGDGQPRLYTI